MDNFFEVLRIVEGALNQDYNKVVAFAKSLATKLEEAGEASAAKKIVDLLSRSKTLELTTTRGTAFNALPLDNESKLALALREEFSRDEIKLYHPETIQQMLDKFIKYVEHSSEFLSRGVDISPSLLLYGPPGCGKSETAKYVAAKLGLPLITARLDSVISSYLGSTAKNLRSLFDFASKERCVLFLDEFDALAKVRDDSQELGELKRVVVSLIQNIDYLDKGTVFIAATNHDHLLDMAVWRRFSYKLKIGMPNERARLGLFRYHTESYSSDAECGRYASMTEGFSGADIKNICTELKREMTLNKRPQIEPSVMIREIVFHKYLPDLENKNQNEQIRFIREKFGKSVTFENISSMFGISKGTVSNILK